MGVEFVTKHLRVAGDLPRCRLVEPSQPAVGKARTSSWYILLPPRGNQEQPEASCSGASASK